MDDRIRAAAAVEFHVGEALEVARSGRVCYDEGERNFVRHDCQLYSDSWREAVARQESPRLGYFLVLLEAQDLIELGFPSEACESCTHVALLKAGRRLTSAMS